MIEENKKYYVYIHLKQNNNEPFYIGKGLNKRAYDINKRSQCWKNYYNKYGRIVVIIDSNLSNEEACKLEILLIKQYGRKDLNKGPLINHTDGGEGNFNFSQETKDKISKSLLGIKQSQETKDKRKNTLIKFYKDNPDMVELKRKQTIELNKKGIIGMKGKKSNKKGTNLTQNIKDEISISLKKYYVNNNPHNFINVEQDIKNKIIIDYNNNIKEFSLHKKYNLSRCVIKRLIKEYINL